MEKMYQIGIKIAKFVLKKYLQVTISTRKYLLPRVLKIKLMKVTKVATKNLYVEKVPASKLKYRGQPALTGTRNELDIAQITLLKS